MFLLFLLVTTALIKLAWPFQPVSHYLVTVGLVVKESLLCKGLSLPNIHIIGHLTPFQLANFATRKVRNVVRYIAVMKDDLLISTFWSDVMMKNELIERTLENDEDNSKSNLNDGGWEHVPLSKDRNMNPVFKVTNRQNLFVWIRLNYFPPNFLFKLSNIFVGMLKKLFDVLFISSGPFGLPFKVKRSNPRNDVSMHVLEMKSVCAVWRNILEMTIDMVLGLSSIG